MFNAKQMIPKQIEVIGYVYKADIIALQCGEEAVGLYKDDNPPNKELLIPLARVDDCNYQLKKQSEQLEELKAQLKKLLKQTSQGKDLHIRELEEGRAGA